MLQRKSQPLFRWDPGWLYLLPGLVLVAAATIIPARQDMTSLDHQVAEVQAKEQYCRERLTAYDGFLAHWEQPHEELLIRLASAQLNRRPSGDRPIVLASSVSTAVTDWIDSGVRYQAPVAAPPSQSMLSRLCSGTGQLWVLAAGALAVFVGLVLGPVSAAQLHEKAGWDENDFDVQPVDRAVAGGVESPVMMHMLCEVDAGVVPSAKIDRPKIDDTSVAVQIADDAADVYVDESSSDVIKASREVVVPDTVMNAEPWAADSPVDAYVAHSVEQSLQTTADISSTEEPADELMQPENKGNRDNDIEMIAEHDEDKDEQWDEDEDEDEEWDDDDEEEWEDDEDGDAEEDEEDDEDGDAEEDDEDGDAEEDDGDGDAEEDDESVDDDEPWEDDDENGDDDVEEYEDDDEYEEDDEEYEEEDEDDDDDDLFVDDEDED